MSSLHRPNFRYEFSEWWRERDSNPLYNVYFFSFCHRKGWIPQSALLPLLPLGMLLMGCIAMLFVGPFPNRVIGAMAVLMLGCLLWLAVRIGAHCRLALIDLLFVSLPILALAYGNLSF